MLFYYLDIINNESNLNFILNVIKLDMTIRV